MVRDLRHLLPASLAALALAGCGGGDEGEPVEGPSEAVPADTPFYLEVSIRPEGEARAGAEAAAAKLLDTDDPGAKIISLLESESKKEGDPIDWEQDISPWLGEKVGLFAPNLSDDRDNDAVLVVETIDPELALEFARTGGNTPASQREREHEGVKFQIDDEGDAFGLVGDFLVVGDPIGFQQAVDAAGSDSLSERGTFQDAVGELPEASLANFYAEPKTLIEAIPTDDPDDETGKEFLLRALGDAGDKPLLGSTVASASGIEVKLSAGGGGTETAPSSLLDTLPSQAWLAIGFSDIGGSIEGGLKALEDANIPGVSVETLSTQIQTQAGIDLQSDVIDNFGDAGFFLAGTSAKDIGGALVIESADPAATDKLLGRLQSYIRQQEPGTRIRPLASTTGGEGFEVIDPSDELDKPIRVFQREGRLIVDYGPQGAALLEGGGQTLSSNPSYQAAQSQLGGLGVDLFVSVQPVLELAENEGARSDPDYRTAKPYLDGLDYLVVGSGSEGDRSVLEILLGIR